MLFAITCITLVLLAVMCIYYAGNFYTVERWKDDTAVLITGCGGGFGKQLTIKCLLNGITVFAGCHRSCSVDELNESCMNIEGKLYAFQMDVTDDESVNDAKQHIESVLNENNLKLHAVVNNAGIRGNHFYDDFLTINDYKVVWEVNVYGAIRVTQTFKDLIKKSKGRIVMCGSACMLFAIPGYGPYASSKAALNAYAEVIRHELVPFGVHVIILIPGSFQTGMQNTIKLLDMMDGVWKRASNKLKFEYGAEYIVKAKALVEKLQTNVISNDVSWVIDAYYQAITTKYPSLINRIGWDTLLFFYPYSMLPLRLQLLVMRIMLQLIGAPMPAIVEQSQTSH